MKNFSSVKRKTLSSVAVVASLGIAAPVAAIGTAHSAVTAVKVSISGTASCAQFGESTPTVVTIAPKTGSTKSDELPGEEQSEKYNISLTGIPEGGTKATAKVTCVDGEGDVNTLKKKDVQIKKPASGSLTLNLP
ncbi:hypothetical protein [Streptomyces virginiae]|uniref:hypothetical protein n=1 Tax=Streptomyces virginiae TaxID=1961 RepID=UPI0036F53C78